MNIDGDLLRAAPVTSRRLFSDVLDPGARRRSRNVDDGARPAGVLFRHGSHLRARLSSSRARRRRRYTRTRPPTRWAWAARHGTGHRSKAGCMDASSTASTSIVMNIITPSSEQHAEGLGVLFVPPRSAGTATTPRAVSRRAGLPTYQAVNQWDVSAGGPIVKDRIWFFGSYRYADLVNGISRTDEDLARLRAFRNDFEPFDNASTQSPAVPQADVRGQSESTALGLLACTGTASAAIASGSTA